MKGPASSFQMAPSTSDQPSQNCRYVAAVDIGTTTIRCCIVNDRGFIVSYACRGVELLHYAPGIAEICPEAIWLDFNLVVQEALDGTK